MSLLTDESREKITEIMGRYPKARSAILPALHVVQEQLGWVPKPAQAEVAEMFEMPAAEVRSLVTFYYMYHRQPVGRYVLKVCRSISCWLCGSNRLIQQLEEELDIKMGETTEDGMFTLIHSECLAGCTAAPLLQVNDRFFENATEERVKELLTRLRAGDESYPQAAESWKGDA